MRLPADRTMKRMKGGGVVMQSLETRCALRACPRVRTERGQDPVAAEVELIQQDQVFQGKEAPHPVDAGCGSLLGGLWWGELGVWTVSTLWVCGLGRTGAGLGRIAYVCGGVPVFARAGIRFESHLGHVFSLFRGLWASECAQTVHLWAPSGAFFVGGRCCGRGSPFFPEGGRLSFGTCSWTPLAWAT